MNEGEEAKSSQWREQQMHRTENIVRKAALSVLLPFDHCSFLIYTFTLHHFYIYGLVMKRRRCSTFIKLFWF